MPLPAATANLNAAGQIIALPIIAALMTLVKANNRGTALLMKMELKIAAAASLCLSLIRAHERNNCFRKRTIPWEQCWKIVLGAKRPLPGASTPNRWIFRRDEDKVKKMTPKEYLCGMIAAAGIFVGSNRVEANNRLNAICEESAWSKRVICLPAERFEIHGEQRLVQDGDKACQYYSSFRVRDTWEDMLRLSIKEVSYALKKEAEKGGLFEEKGCSKFTLEIPPASWSVNISCRRDENAFNYQIFPRSQFSVNDDDIVLRHIHYSVSEEALRIYPLSKLGSTILTEYKFDVDSNESAVFFAGKLEEMRGILEMMLRHGTSRHGISKETIERKLSAEKKRCEQIAEKNE